MHAALGASASAERAGVGRGVFGKVQTGGAWGCLAFRRDGEPCRHEGDNVGETTGAPPRGQGRCHRLAGRPDLEGMGRGAGERRGRARRGPRRVSSCPSCLLRSPSSPAPCLSTCWLVFHRPFSAPSPSAGPPPSTPLLTPRDFISNSTIMTLKPLYLAHTSLLDPGPAAGERAGGSACATRRLHLHLHGPNQRSLHILAPQPAASPCPPPLFGSTLLMSPTRNLAPWLRAPLGFVGRSPCPDGLCCWG